jgi:nifR3 family TIM-barrel protein
MKISNIEFPSRPLFLAPMEDVTDADFRLLCRRFGADMVYSEFVSSEALNRNIPRTLQKINVLEEERPVAIQIYGTDPEVMAESARKVEMMHPDIIDINFGCPVKKVAGKGAGAGMLKDIPKMLEITLAVVKAVNVPVTVKTRLGWDDSSKIIVELAEMLQDCGIQALTIHGRTRQQMYKGEADWTLIGEVKNNPRIKIPIIGNGDITTPEQAKEFFNRYGVDAIMIGRAAIGQPWIFSEMKHVLDDDFKYFPLSFEEKKVVLKNYILSAVRRLDIDEQTPIENVFDKYLKGIVHSRRHLAATSVFKNIPNFKSTRIAMLRADTLSELFGIIDAVDEPFCN